MTTPDGLKAYLLNGMAGTPVLMAALAKTVRDWDARPDPDRFTLREMIAHVADWDLIFSERLNRLVNEETPFLPSVDEGILCAERNYANQDPHVNLTRLVESRAKLVAQFEALPSEAWNRTAHREFVGDINVGQLAAMILGHDAYHLRQLVDQA